jgi:hypothetical protein
MNSGVARLSARPAKGGHGGATASEMDRGALRKARPRVTRRRERAATSLAPMPFRPEKFAAAEAGIPGEIDYRLARQAIVAEYRKGRLAKHEVCDAHPELRRVALAHGAPSKQLCPICEEQPLVLVTYAFGPRLPAHGRCLTQRGELAQLTKRGGAFGCYVVEVCTGCWWNHLARSFIVDGGERRVEAGRA